VEEHRYPGRRYEPLLWLAPSLLLVLGVLAYPIAELLRTSLSEVSPAGVNRGLQGLDNYARLLGDPGLWAVVLRTGLWVLFTVLLTTVAALGVAQLLNARYPGRRMLRFALIVPWAASTVVTTLSWQWMLNFYYGFVNQLFLDLGLIGSPVNWTGGYDLPFATLVFLAVFGSVPFTAYVILAGLQSIPDELYQAARVDGASTWRAFRAIQVPLLRPALLVATVLNGIFSFNTFTVIWLLTEGGPGGTTDITTTYAYKLAFMSRDIGQAAALNVVNLMVLVLGCAVYVGIINRRGHL